MTDLLGEVPANERRVNHAGLMRCCLASVAENDELTVVGSVMDCKYEPADNEQLIVDAGGVWVWNK